MKMKKLLSINSFQSKYWVWISYLLFISFLVLIVLTFKDYGITYDESWRSTYGNLIIKWYTSSFHDKAALSYWNLYYYGGFSDVIEQLATRISPIGVYETRHFINAIFGLLAVIGVYKLGKYVTSPFVGFLSALFLVTTARFYGHSFNNPVDIPFAALSIFALYYLVQLVHQLPKPAKSLSLKLGITLGLALGIRIGAIVLVGYCVLALFLWLINRSFIKNEKLTIETIKDNLYKPALLFFFIFIVAFVTMLIWWPAAQVNPIKQPVRAIRFTTNFQYEFNVFFDGKIIPNTQLPWYYLLKWFLITLPEFYFLALLGGLVVLLFIVTHPQKLRNLFMDQNDVGVMIILVGALFPLIFTTLTKPVDYDAIRHFLFVIPPLSIVAANSVAKFLERSHIWLINVLFLAGILISIVLTISDMVRLHPDEYIYFNRLFGGGVAQASKSYDMDYWGNSYKEAVAWVVNNYPAPADGPKLKIASCLFSLSTSYYLHDNRFEYIGSYGDGQPVRGTPDLFLANPRWGCDKKLQGEVIHTITRMGAPLTYIIKVTQNLK
jgi:4-amino-4-deoxy-L-arabinose transferase-like glycosyltransferase